MPRLRKEDFKVEGYTVKPWSQNKTAKTPNNKTGANEVTTVLHCPFRKENLFLPGY
jgi:hypothetical protein